MARVCSPADNSLANCDSNSVAVASILRPRDANCNDSSWSVTVPVSSENSNNYQLSNISDTQKSSLTEVLKNVLLIMEDITESYPEVNEISSVLQEIEQTLKVR